MMQELLICVASATPSPRPCPCHVSPFIATNCTSPSVAACLPLCAGPVRPFASLDICPWDRAELPEWQEALVRACQQWREDAAEALATASACDLLARCLPALLLACCPPCLAAAALALRLFRLKRRPACLLACLPTYPQGGARAEAIVDRAEEAEQYLWAGTAGLRKMHCIMQTNSHQLGTAALGTFGCITDKQCPDALLPACPTCVWCADVPEDAAELAARVHVAAAYMGRIGAALRGKHSVAEVEALIAEVCGSCWLLPCTSSNRALLESWSTGWVVKHGIRLPA